MSAASEYFDRLGADVLDVARDALASGGVRVYVKTNLGPEVPVTGGGGGLADALGLRAAVVVRDRDGRRLAGYGEYPATDPWRAALLAAAAALLGYVLFRGVFKR